MPKFQVETRETVQRIHIIDAENMTEAARSVQFLGNTGEFVYAVAPAHDDRLWFKVLKTCDHCDSPIILKDDLHRVDGDCGVCGMCYENMGED